MDRLEINIQMPIASDELIHGFTALVYYNVKFSEKVKYLIDAVSYVNYDSGGGMSALTLDGDLVLRQTWPLEGKGGYKVCLSMPLSFIYSVLVYSIRCTTPFNSLFLIPIPLYPPFSRYFCV